MFAVSISDVQSKALKKSFCFEEIHHNKFDGWYVVGGFIGRWLYWSVVLLVGGIGRWCRSVAWSLWSVVCGFTARLLSKLNGLPPGGGGYLAYEHTGTCRWKI